MRKAGLWISKQKTNVFILQRNTAAERRSPEDCAADHRGEAAYGHEQARAWVTDSTQRGPERTATPYLHAFQKALPP